VKPKTKAERLTEAVIAYRDKMAAAGFEFTAASPAEDGKPANITFYLHGDDCASRSGKDCDCRTSPGEAE
jgi:hypothetical protein